MLIPGVGIGSDSVIDSVICSPFTMIVTNDDARSSFMLCFVIKGLPKIPCESPQSITCRGSSSGVLDSSSSSRMSASNCPMGSMGLLFTAKTRGWVGVSSSGGNSMSLYVSISNASMALPVSTRKAMALPNSIPVRVNAAGASSASMRAVLLVVIPLTEIVPTVGLLNLGLF